jgi:hypothetical protein
MNQDSVRFQQIVEVQDKNAQKVQLEEFITENPILKGVSPAQILAIAKMVCAGADTICPIINAL